MTTQKHVLIVEDEDKIAQILVEFLALEGFTSTVLNEGTHVVDTVKKEAPAAIILDRMLPGMDGLTICKSLRRFSMVPIIMLTARVDEIDRLIGLEAGADDYVCKPFSAREVVARIQAVLRRSTQQISSDASTDKLEFRHIELDMSRFECAVDGKTIELTPVEFRLLKTMMTKPGVVYSRDQLMELAYEDGRVVSNRTIDSHMKNLRQKLMAPEHTSPIHAVYGIGYKVQ
ncbi:response regulator [Alteromonas sp. 1_MG-2023]|uniref:response regulator n=1 Tax=Alteromonas sp. 1_MG-2023 TaxID=3062669 RepID=UPI0026E4650C|nr:response regulator [Alteromonas sp. 1_MG-2023]MDO6567626.1 response regulator [Alteromonas sp. 1_MG-2023]